jgi:6-phosphogluconolactonase
MKEDQNIKSWDKKKNWIVLDNETDFVSFAARDFIQKAAQSIDQKDAFFVALSGGSTPRKVYQTLYKEHKNDIDWSKVFLFFSDERVVPLDHPESNYHMAMEAGFAHLPIPKKNIFPMNTEKTPQESAEKYNTTIDEITGEDLFDLVLLGVGEDGHTASLFPETKGLSQSAVAACANFVPQKSSWRITLTFDCINASSSIVFYASGAKKQEILEKIFYPKKNNPIFPAECVGTEDNPALWIMDKAAAKKLLASIR